MFYFPSVKKWGIVVCLRSWLYYLCSRKLMLETFLIFPRKTIEQVSWGGKDLFIVFIGGAKWRHTVSFMPKFLSVSEMARVNEPWTSFTPGASPGLRTCNLSQPKPGWSHYNKELYLLPWKDNMLTHKRHVYLYLCVRNITMNLYKCSAEKLDKQAPSGHGSDSSASKG